MENPKFDSIRFIFRSYKFQQLSEHDKLATINKIVDTGVNMADVMRIYNEITNKQKESASETFRRIDKNPLFEILLRSKPIDVLNLCRTTPKFADLCRNNKIFERLMEAHFPNKTIEADARKQYTDYALKNGNIYKVKIEGWGTNVRNFRLIGSFKNDEIFPRYNTILSMLPLDGSSNYLFKIYGKVIDDPVEFWKIYDTETKDMYLGGMNGNLLN